MNNQTDDNESYYYSINETSMGWIGIAGNENGLRKIILPEKNKETVLRGLNIFFHPETKLIPSDKDFFSIINRIKEYFNGKSVMFKKDIINLEGYSVFQKKILLKTREIPYGETRTYRWLAENSGYPKAYRAAGGVMRINPLPLIIPCHRVIGSFGKLTGFSATGGLKLKKSMLELEGVF